MAYVDAFIHDLPNGYATEVGERGVKLSGDKDSELLLPERYFEIRKFYASMRQLQA